MLILKKNDIPSSEITPKQDYLNRRAFMAGVAAAGLAAVAGTRGLRGMLHPAGVEAAEKLNTIKSPLSTTGEPLTPLEDITHYNNFYEFGVNKDDPAKNAGSLHTRPWAVKVEGLVNKPKTFDIDDLLKLRPME